MPRRATSLRARGPRACASMLQRSVAAADPWSTQLSANGRRKRVEQRQRDFRGWRGGCPSAGHGVHRHAAGRHHRRYRGWWVPKASKLTTASALSDVVELGKSGKIISTGVWVIHRMRRKKSTFRIVKTLPFKSWIVFSHIRTHQFSSPWHTLNLVGLFPPLNVILLLHHCQNSNPCGRMGTKRGGLTYFYGKKKGTGVHLPVYTLFWRTENLHHIGRSNGLQAVNFLNKKWFSYKPFYIYILWRF